MKYLVDSDVVADWLQGRSEAVTLLTSLHFQELAISLITYGEIHEGVLYSRDPQKAGQVFRLFCRNITILSINRSIMRHFGRLRGQLRTAGNVIPDFDLLIAATAMHYGLMLVTRNTRHFDRISGLSLYEPSTSN